ncbi:MAG: hypothetical protein AVDCRST_MAG66-2626, partial [uncultured Pseudonocardia sp.]
AGHRAAVGAGRRPRCGAHRAPGDGHGLVVAARRRQPGAALLHRVQPQLAEALALHGDPAGRPAGEDVVVEQGQVDVLGARHRGQGPDQGERLGEVDGDVRAERERPVGPVDDQSGHVDGGDRVVQQAPRGGDRETRPQVRGQGVAALGARVHRQVRHEPAGVGAQRDRSGRRGEGEGPEDGDPVGGVLRCARSSL